MLLNISSKRLGQWVRLTLRGALVGALVGVGACGSSTESPVAPLDAEAAVCPPTPEDTVGKPCGNEGLVCGPQYSCGITQASLYCVCTGDTFQCRDGENRTVAPGATLPCDAVASTPAPCPASEAAAGVAACSLVGQICAYQSRCPSMFDTCSCFPGATADGGFGPVFICKAAICGSDAGLPDAGP
jgi:hypothetical protein